MIVAETVVSLSLLQCAYHTLRVQIGSYLVRTGLTQKHIKPPSHKSEEKKSLSKQRFLRLLEVSRIGKQPTL